MDFWQCRLLFNKSLIFEQQHPMFLCGEEFKLWLRLTSGFPKIAAFEEFYSRCFVVMLLCKHVSYYCLLKKGSLYSFWCYFTFWICNMVILIFFCILCKLLMIMCAKFYKVYYKKSFLLFEEVEGCVKFLVSIFLSISQMLIC